ncbi:hypothetical protein J31TS3_26490 [Paenibacillus lactis]|nr:hypothetical protein J31TS3_26490 [Paenibacillus lactis]
MDFIQLDSKSPKAWIYRALQLRQPHIISAGVSEWNHTIAAEILHNTQDMTLIQSLRKTGWLSSEAPLAKLILKSAGESFVLLVNIANIRMISAGNYIWIFFG